MQKLAFLFVAHGVTVVCGYLSSLLFRNDVNKNVFFLHLLKIAFLSITRTDGILQPPAKRNGCVIWVIALLKMYFHSTTFFFKQRSNAFMFGANNEDHSSVL